MPLWTINFCHSIVILDELDVLISRCQSLMYNFFDWPNRPSSRTVLIAIANTMDLPERFLTNKISSRLGLHRINFQPYTHTELFSILQAKLATALYDKDALELCTRKVGAVSGDARKALELWTRAIDVSKGRCGDALRVSIEDVHTAIKESYSVDVTSCLHSFSFHQKLFLTSLWKCLRRDSVQQVPFFDVRSKHKSPTPRIICTSTIGGTFFMCVGFRDA